ncbi:hypothetical protein PRIC2_011384 [Phytophthora ramorum]
MKRPRRTRLRASFVTLALLVVAMQTAVTAQIMPADSGATDAATVVPAGGTSAASSASTESPTEAPATTYPAATEAPIATTASPTITNAAAPAAPASATSAPVATEAPANRVTVPRETGISSGIFVTDPLTPRDEIAVTIPSNNLPRTKTADLIAGSAAQAFNRRTRPAGSSGSIDTPTDSYNGNGYDSFTGRNHTPSIVSVASSNAYNSNSVYSDTSSISLGSIAPSVSSSQRSFAPSGLSDQFTRPRLQTVASQGRSSKRASSATSIGDGRDTNRSDRSSSDFSVFNTSVASTEEDIYRISTQLIDVSAIPATTSEKSEPNSKDSYHSNDRLSGLSEFSVDESYTSDLSVHERFGTELSIDNDSLSFSTADSFGTADSYTTGSSNGTTDSLLDRDSVVFRNSKESELSEGEI